MMKFLAIASLIVAFSGCYDGIRPKAEVPVSRRFKIVTVVDGQTNVVYVYAKKAKKTNRLFLD